MHLFIIALVVGTVLGLLRGGRIGALADLRLRAPGLLAVAVAVQAVLAQGLAPASWLAPALVASYLLVGVWLVQNAVGRGPALRVGMVVVGLGWALNLVPIAANGAMPVSSTGGDEAGVDAAQEVAEAPLGKRVAAGADADAGWLGDVVPVRPLAAVVSLGDLAMLAGLVLVVAAGTRPSPVVAPLPA